MKKRNGAQIPCQACGNKFYVPNYRKKSAKFCSHECQNHKQYDKYEFECFACGKKCITSPSRKNYKKKYCSLECREFKRMDEKERRKKQKASAILSRGSHSGKTTRKYLFEFKEKKCEICGYKEFDFCLDMHHKDGNCRNNSLENLIVLCVMCHRKVHKKIIFLGEENASS